MILIKVDNSECKIENLTIEQHKKLKDELSYLLNANAPQNIWKKRVSLLGKGGLFPTGLLPRVLLHLNKQMLKYTLNDIRRIPTPQKDLFKLSLRHTPYPDQIKATNACLKHSRGIVVCPTGTGKSLICTLIINELQVPTLVIVPSLELKRQLTGTLVGAFGVSKVGLNKDICVENVDSNNLKKLKKQYDCVIIDEFHHSGAKTYRNHNKKLWNKTYYKLGLTATPFRSQDSEQILLESVLSQVIYQLSYDKAVKEGYIVPMEAYYVELPKVKVTGTKWAEVYKQTIVENEARNETIAQLLKSLSDKSILCLVKEIAHGMKLRDLIDGWFAHGENEDTPHLITMFNKTSLKTLIGTTGVIGEGIDTKPCEYVIIAGLGKSRNAFMQQCGRGFRRFGTKESCKIIIFLDRSHKFTIRHYKEQCKYLLQEYGIIPQKIEI